MRRDLDLSGPRKPIAAHSAPPSKSPYGATASLDVSSRGDVAIRARADAHTAGGR